MCMHVKIYKNNEDHEDLLVMYSDKSIQIMSKRLYASSLWSKAHSGGITHSKLKQSHTLVTKHAL